MFRKKNREKVLEHTKRNREEVLASETCGCLNCLAVFPPEDIQEWTPPEEMRDWAEEGGHGHRRGRVDQTAICPHCGEAMIIGDHSGLRIAPATLDALRAHMR